MDSNSHANAMDALVAQGEIINAVNKYFDEHATTSDYGSIKTNSKSEMLKKMEGFLGSIAKVNGIRHHRTIANGNSSASEFTFDFDMKDGSKVYWHEIIRREWKDGKVVEEEYFNAGG